MTARKRSAEEKKNRNNDWARMVTEKGARERLLKESPHIVAALDHMVKMLKEYEGSGWVVFSDWHLDVLKIRRNKWPFGLYRPELEEVWEAVFPVVLEEAA